MDAFIHYGMAAAVQAVQDAGLPHGQTLGEAGVRTLKRCVMVGSGIGGLPLIEQTQSEYQARGPRRISPFFVPASIINMISGHVSIRYGYTGPNLAIVTACTTGLHCIGEAGRMIGVRRRRRDGRRRRAERHGVAAWAVGGFAAARAAVHTAQRRPARPRRAPGTATRDGYSCSRGFGVAGTFGRSRGVRTRQQARRPDLRRTVPDSHGRRRLSHDGAPNDRRPSDR